MGRHADEKRGRGVAGWLVIVIISVVVVAILAASSYFFVFRSDSTQAACNDEVSVSIVTGPTSAAAIEDAADAYNAAGRVVRSACVTARVSSMSDAAARDALEHGWPSHTVSAPGLWIPDNPAALAALDAVDPSLAAGHATDALAWSPLVLAVQPRDAAAVPTLSWSGIATAAESGTSIDLIAGRSLAVALAPVTSAQATSYFAQSLLINNGTAVTEEMVDSHDSLLASLANSADSAVSPRTTDEALAALADPTTQDSPAGATAVPVVEAQLISFDRDTTGTRLVGVHPDGPTVGDAVIPAPITAAWTTQTLHSAASDFDAFLASQAGQQILADHGWRTVSAQPSHPLEQVDTGVDVTMVANAAPAVDRAIAVALGQELPSSTTTSATETTTSPPETTELTAPTESTGSVPATEPTASTTPTTTPSTTTPPTTTSPAQGADGPVLTIIVDTSSGMGDELDGTVLLDGVKHAIEQVVDAHLTDRIGLWAYSDAIVYPPSGYPELVSTGPLDDEVPVPSLHANDDETDIPTEPRADALDDALTLLTPEGDRWAYGALMGALQDIPDAAVDGRQSRVLLIVSGVDQTPGTPRRLVLGAVKKAADTVRVDTIGIGDAVPVDAYSDIAHAGGGEYVPVLDVSKLGQQIIDLLTLGD